MDRDTKIRVCFLQFKLNYKEMLKRIITLRNQLLKKIDYSVHVNFLILVIKIALKNHKNMFNVEKK